MHACHYALNLHAWTKQPSKSRQIVMLAVLTRAEKDELVKYFINITKNDTIMNNWLSRARLQTYKLTPCMYFK